MITGITGKMYLLFFPYPFVADALWPHAYMVKLAEERSSRNNANSYSMRPTEIETVNVPGHGGITLRDTLNDVESGRSP
nr:unnamed protein product [Digitaria exilis]